VATSAVTALNRIKVISRDGQRYLRRVWADPQIAARLGADRHAEIHAHRLAATAGLAPTIRCLDPEWRWFEMDYVPGGLLEPDWPLREKRALQLWQRLDALQAIDPTGLPTVDPLGRSAELLQHVVAVDPCMSELWHKQLTLLGSERPRFVTESARRCFVHGDLNRANILIDAADQLQLIDWEYAHAGDPLEDIAGLLVSEPELRRQWQQHGRITRELDWWVRCRELLDDLWTALSQRLPGAAGLAGNNGAREAN